MQSISLSVFAILVLSTFGQDIDDCAGVICIYGTVCVDGINSYTCRCPLGYTGENCASPCIDTCNKRLYKPKCGSDGRTYRNRCYLLYAQCTEDQSIKMVHRGACAGRGPIAIVGGETRTCIQNESGSSSGGDSSSIEIVNCPPPTQAPLPPTMPPNPIVETTEAIPATTMPPNLSVVATTKSIPATTMQSTPNVTTKAIPATTMQSTPKVTTKAIPATTMQSTPKVTTKAIPATTPCADNCALVFEPVCGSDGVTYPNICKLEVVRCLSDPTLVAVSTGECVVVTTPCRGDC